MMLKKDNEIDFRTFYQILKTEPIEPDSGKEIALKLGGLIGEHFRVEKIFLIGSMAEWTRYRPGSDIDLVVKGLTAAEWNRLKSFIYGRTPFFIDIRRYEDFTEHSKIKIIKKGLILFDNEQYEHQD